MSPAMIRLIAGDEGPMSLSAAFRLVKFFKTEPKYWLELQMDFDLLNAAKNKELTKALKNISTVDEVCPTKPPISDVHGLR
jgi:plasmid maintenance system antidote protein VapI